MHLFCFALLHLILQERLLCLLRIQLDNGPFQRFVHILKVLKVFVANHFNG
jgi:hypothetical protein